MNYKSVHRNYWACPALRWLVDTFALGSPGNWSWGGGWRHLHSTWYTRIQFNAPAFDPTHPRLTQHVCIVFDAFALGGCMLGCTGHSLISGSSKRWSLDALCGLPLCSPPLPSYLTGILDHQTYLVRLDTSMFDMTCWMFNLTRPCCVLVGFEVFMLGSKHCRLDLRCWGWIQGSGLSSRHWGGFRINEPVQIPRSVSLSLDLCHCHQICGIVIELVLWLSNLHHLAFVVMWHPNADIQLVCVVQGGVRCVV